MLSTSFRPHVWGFFFHFMYVVFVPMYGDSFFTIQLSNPYLLLLIVFVPMYGDSFFTR